MLRATIGLAVVGFIFYHSPVRQPLSGADVATSTVTDAAQLGLRGVLADSHLDNVTAGVALGRVLLDRPRVPQRIISLSDPGMAAQKP